MKRYSEAIREARKAAGLTQSGLADRLNWGENGQTRISNYELGTREPSQHVLQKMALAMGVDVGAMLDLGEHRPKACTEEPFKELVRLAVDASPEKLSAAITLLKS